VSHRSPLLNLRLSLDPCPLYRARPSTATGPDSFLFHTDNKGLKPHTFSWCYRCGAVAVRQVGRHRCCAAAGWRRGRGGVGRGGGRRRTSLPTGPAPVVRRRRSTPPGLDDHAVWKKAFALHPSIECSSLPNLSSHQFTHLVVHTPGSISSLNFFSLITMCPPTHTHMRGHHIHFHRVQVSGYFQWMSAIKVTVADDGYSLAALIRFLGD
jgi:hypothetical protein